MEENSTCAKIAQVQKEGNRRVTRNISYYNLDMIISIGFRVNSKPAIKFRTWVNKIIKEYIIKGFALNDDRFINGNKFDTRYFDKLDVGIAKNYLKKDELEKLNDLTNLFLDVAETEAKEQKTMAMSKWIEVADDLLKYRKKNILKDAGKISHKQAIEKANKEYEKFRIQQDEEYISSMDQMLDKYLKENK